MNYGAYSHLFAVCYPPSPATFSAIRRRCDTRNFFAGSLKKKNIGAIPFSSMVFEFQSVFSPIIRGPGIPSKNTVSVNITITATTCTLPVYKNITPPVEDIYLLGYIYISHLVGIDFKHVPISFVQCVGNLNILLIRNYWHWSRYTTSTNVEIERCVKLISRCRWQREHEVLFILYGQRKSKLYIQNDLRVRSLTNRNTIYIFTLYTTVAKRKKWNAPKNK